MPDREPISGNATLARSQESHRYLDEAGDTTFFGRGHTPAIGIEKGVSLCFILGMVKFRSPLDTVRTEIEALAADITNDSYLSRIPSIAKKVAAGRFYFHATDDPPEVRMQFYKFIAGLDMSYEGIVGRKIPRLFMRNHAGSEANFYADVLSHLLKNKLQTGDRLVLTVSERGNTTRDEVLHKALALATERLHKKRPAADVKTEVVFNVQSHRTEPLLNVADYACWAVQRVFERGETRYYDFVEQKVALVVDLYDRAKWLGNRNYYTHRNRLSPGNKIGPPSY